MDEEKVYAIGENKCLKETMTKQQISEGLNKISSTVFGIKKTEKRTEYVATVHTPLPETNTRISYLAGLSHITFNNSMTEIPDSYYFEVVVQFTTMNQRKLKPSDLISVNGITTKFLNDDLETVKYSVLHYYFTYDGISLCCWCTGYGK